LFRSEMETQGSAAAYIFSGSHPGLMRDLFSDRRHAFFAQAAPTRLGPLPPDELADYVLARFREGRRDPGEALGPLLDAAEGHPQRAMLLAHHLYERVRGGETARIDEWIDSLDAARLEVHGEIQVLWESCTSLERKVLKAVAQETVSLSSREADVRFGITKGGSTRAAVQRLWADGQLTEDETTRSGWRIVDPFLAAWLREA